MPADRNGSGKNGGMQTLLSPEAIARSEDDAILENLGHYAYHIIQKNFKKIVKYEKAVLEDTDPEPLHQMRVGMRRLRSALQVCKGAVNLPKAGGERPIQKLARCLGELRDLDVLIEKLHEHYRPALKGKARNPLDRALKALKKQRKKRFAAVKMMMKGDRYRQFKTAYQDWLDQPQYGAIATYPVQEVLPDLWGSSISETLLHPGWLFCVIPEQLPLMPSRLSPGALHKALTSDGETLHSLRKQMKRIRYQAEFFEDIYPDLNGYIQDFKAIQEALGQLQDCAVVRSTLTDSLGKRWKQKWPAIARLVQHDEETAWQDWQPYQAQYLRPKYRQQLRSMFYDLCFQAEGRATASN
jgi:CHAD domain-containing protein